MFFDARQVDNFLRWGRVFRWKHCLWNGNKYRNAKKDVWFCLNSSSNSKYIYFLKDPKLLCAFFISLQGLYYHVISGHILSYYIQFYHVFVLWKWVFHTSVLAVDFYVQWLPNCEPYLQSKPFCGCDKVSWIWIKKLESALI